jgi:hypothetical protein
MRDEHGPHFINVDLEVRGAEDLSALAAALESRSCVLYSGKEGRRFLVSIEAHPSQKSPEATIWALLAVIKSLPQAARAFVKRAESRTFNIGYGAGTTLTLMYETPPGSGVWRPKGSKLRTYEASLTPKLLRAVADLGGTISTTLYPATREVRGRRPKR